MQENFDFDCLTVTISFVFYWFAEMKLWNNNSTKVASTLAHFMPAWDRMLTMPYKIGKWFYMRKWIAFIVLHELSQGWSKFVTRRSDNISSNDRTLLLYNQFLTNKNDLIWKKYLLWK